MKNLKKHDDWKDNLSMALRNFNRRTLDLLRDLRSEKLPRLVIVVFLIIAIGGGLVAISEFGTDTGMFTGIVDALWYGVVTITTVGYGDKFPVTIPGRIFAAIVMFTGVVVTSILSGTIASIFVDRKIREGKGLQDVITKSHIIICGWNKNAENILENFGRFGKKNMSSIILINEMDPEVFQELQARNVNLDLRFVRGDFTNDKVLKRANIQQAMSVILIPDTSGDKTIANSDERIILAVLAIKALSPDIKVSAEVINAENESHLRRADVDNVLVNGEFSGFLLANSTFAVGIPRVVKELLTVTSEKNLIQSPIPSAFIGKTFAEFSEYSIKNGKGVVIGILSEEKKMSLDDILSNDSSSIDAFIKRKFMEAEIDIAEEQASKMQTHISPDPGYIIKDTDSAFIIGSRTAG